MSLMQYNIQIYKYRILYIKSLSSAKIQRYKIEKDNRYTNVLAIRMVRGIILLHFGVI